LTIPPCLSLPAVVPRLDRPVGFQEDCHFPARARAPMVPTSLLLTMFLVVGRAGDARRTELEGTWRGTLGQGAGALRLVLTLARSGNGSYSGVVDSIDQGATIPIDKVSVRANRVTLEVGSVGGTYDGVLGRNDTRLSGTRR
jgi:hypothetical protein